MHETLAASLPLLKILLSFVAMLVLIRFRLPLGLAILGGSALLGLFFGLAPTEWIATVAAAPFKEKPLYLTAIIALIMALSRLLEESGQTRRLMRSIAGVLTSPRLRMAFFASLIGLLPMPGGAIFSAPMVAGAAEGLDVRPERLALINYWFRHIWELGWPLYPGVILASSLAGMPITGLISLTLPAVLLSLVLGWLFFLRPGVLPLPRLAAVADEPFRPRELFREGLPLLVAIGGAVAMEVGISVLRPDLPFEVGMCVALALAIVCTLLQNTGGLVLLLRTLVSKSFLTMLAVIVGIFAYQDVLHATGAVARIAELTGGGAALALTAGLLPFLVGTVTGITLAYVGTTFPLILTMAAQTGTDPIACVVLGLFCGYAGLIVSPLHICLVLTCEYFHTDLAPVWRSLVLPGAILIAAGYLYYFLLI